MRKRILCIIDSLGAGGAQRQMYYLATSLKKAGFDVKILTYFPTIFYQKDLDESGIEYECVSNAAGYMLRIPNINNAIKKFNPDTVIAFLDTPCIIACICRWMQRKKWNLIVSERNTTQTITRRERLKFKLYSMADKIVPNSYAQIEFIKRFFPKLIDKSEVIINMVDLNRFSPDFSKKNNEKVIITVVASVWESKNTIGFITAVKDVVDRGFTDFKIKWFGIVDNDYCVQAQAFVKKIGVEKWFTILPKTNNIEREYKKSDWFCLPSYFEGTPNVICEAMACGLPILCSDICDNGKYVKDDVNGYLFNPLSTESMADAIIKAITCKQTEEFGKESREIAERTFSYESFSQKYINLINHLDENNENN